MLKNVMRFIKIIVKILKSLLKNLNLRMNVNYLQMKIFIY